MQAALGIATPIPITHSKASVPWASHVRARPFALRLPRSSMAGETSTVDYSSSTSVFPAEACDTVGGEACAAVMYPEVKPKAQSTTSKVKTVTEEVEREYLEYNEPKTVFPNEACDDLGGEFCEAEYQKGVFKEEASPK
ncbi:light-regulated protein [Amborella trichopoda]|uniref:Light-regulated protein n=1 Tax=Amborella trichopoda TaxID=13333 RepID=W1P8M3_AMBTC|nr:light-regulated protein [Amborella trichopoda]ERN06212.1 hypothetical protein AMTR_s00016p00166750 [Amborella trichopoda]|eukprot:XP_006844537.1 light-regulated protein [Amborella trichopoda]